MNPHFSEAWDRAMQITESWTRENLNVERSLLIHDVLGKSRLVVWKKDALADEELEELNKKLKENCGQWWSGDVWTPQESEKATQMLYEETWDEADKRSLEFATINRHRRLESWFMDPQEPIQGKTGAKPPRITAFRGEAPETRAAAAQHALEQVKKGKRICVIDFRLDRPDTEGVSELLARQEPAEHGALMAPAIDAADLPECGIIDFLVEKELNLPLRDYFCSRGALHLFHAGHAGHRRIEAAHRLAKVDFGTEEKGLIRNLMERIAGEIHPDEIIVDIGCGLTDHGGAWQSTGTAHIFDVVREDQAFMDPAEWLPEGYDMPGWTRGKQPIRMKAFTAQHLRVGRLIQNLEKEAGISMAEIMEQIGKDAQEERL